MFRLISLNLNDDNVLGHIPKDKLVFIPESEINKTKLPYSTVIIGPNGTGKSTLLSYIAKIFEDLQFYKNNQKRNPSSLNFPYSISYQIDKKKYTIENRNKGLDRETKDGKVLIRWGFTMQIDDDETNNWEEIILPSQILAVSYLPMDRFRQKRNLPDDFYQYLGLRHRSNAASPQYFLNNTLPLLFNYIAQSNSTRFLKEILKFMGADSTYLGIQLEYRYKKFFFTGNIKIKEFQELFENPKLFSKREGTSFAVDYYNRYIKEDNQLIKKIVKYLNVRVSQDKITVGEKSILDFNLFDNIELIEELSLIQHLQKLDLLTSASLLFRKNRDKTISSQDLSSGEFHFLTTMIAIQATLKENSLVLIDEPDTSLHPNWQMKYIHNLKELFKSWNSTHFVMATHSHFLISDLENTSSEIIGIKGQAPNIQVHAFNYNTYGWSAEEVLLEVFNVPTTRNLYVYEKVGEILDLVALRDENKNKIGKNDNLEVITKKLEELNSKGIKNLSEEDPLKEIITKLFKKYGRSQ